MDLPILFLLVHAFMLSKGTRFIECLDPAFIPMLADLVKQMPDLKARDYDANDQGCGGQEEVPRVGEEDGEAVEWCPHEVKVGHADDEIEVQTVGGEGGGGVAVVG